MNLLAPPQSASDLRRRMNAVLAAEKLRVAWRLIAEVRDLRPPGTQYHVAACEVRHLGTEAAREVSGEYAADYAQPIGYRRDDAGARFAHLLQELVTADRAELEALAADAQCVYRTQAGRVLELLKSFEEGPKP